jgi:hypothetical protein
MSLVTRRIGEPKPGLKIPPSFFEILERVRKVAQALRRHRNRAFIIDCPKP